MKKTTITTTILLLILLLTACRRERTPAPVYVPVLVQYIEDFDDDRDGWSFADGNNLAYGVVSNGTFKLDYNDYLSDAYYVSRNVRFNPNDDFTLYTRIGSDNNMGLLFGYNVSAGSYGYSFTMDYDGYYALYDEGGNGYGPDIQEVVAPQTGNFTRKNGDWNELRLEQRGARWIGFVNNVQVFDIPAENLSSGSIGFVVIAETQGEADYIQADWYE